MKKNLSQMQIWAFLKIKVEIWKHLKAISAFEWALAEVLVLVGEFETFEKSKKNGGSWGEVDLLQQSSLDAWGAGCLRSWLVFWSPSFGGCPSVGNKVALLKGKGGNLDQTSLLSPPMASGIWSTLGLATTTQFWSVSFMWKIIELPGGQINDP